MTNQTRESLPSLPESVDACHEEIRRLHDELAWLKHQLFGPKADRLQEPSEQLDAFGSDEPLPDGSGEAEAPEVKRSRPKSKGHGRRDLSGLTNIPILERIIHQLSPEDGFCTDCGIDKELMPPKRRFRLGLRPARLFRIEEILEQKVCPDCRSNVSTAEAPMELVEGGMADIIVRKYEDHLPLYRQEKIFRRHGVDLSEPPCSAG